MEERNQILREKLTTMHTWTIAAAACIVLMFIPIINLIAVVIALIAAIVVFLAMLKLKDLHDDYHTAFMLSVINMPLAIMGSSLGGTMEAIVDIISSLVNFGQTYYIVRATNCFLTEGGRGDVVEKGRTAVRLYAINLVVGLLVGALALISVELGVALSVVLLIVSIAAMVVYIKYLGAAKDCF